MAKVRALVVDDGAMNRSFVKTYLTTQGFEVETADDGLQGLEKAKAGEFNVVFSDVEMPNMNGLEFLKNLKRIDSYKQVPVIMLTTVDKQDVMDRADRLGASYYMVKPFNDEKMEDALKKVGLR